MTGYDPKNRESVEAFIDAKQQEINGLMEQFGNELAKHCWGDVPPLSTPVRKTTLRQRVRYRWRSIRESVARAALWVLRINPNEICECDP